MRNYYKTLRLATSASRSAINEALNKDGENADTTTSAMNNRHWADAQDILNDDHRHQLYTDMVQLYERLHEASACLESAPGLDSHLWNHRLIDFADRDEITDPV